MASVPGGAEQENGYGRLFTLLKEHFVWISPVAVVLAFLAGLLNLLAFTWFIGRPELFSRSLEFGPSLALLMLSYLAIFAAIVASMLSTSCFFTITLQQLRPKPEAVESMTRSLLIMVVGGMSLVIVLVPILVHLRGGQLSAWWALIVFIVPTCLSWPFILRYTDKAEALASPMGGWKAAGLYVALILAVALVTFLGILPAQYTLSLYRDSAGLSAWAEVIELVLTCLIVMASSLAPAFGFYINAKKGLAAQIKGSFIGLAAFLGVLTFAMPAIFSVASVSSVRLLGFSDREVRHYLVNSEQYPVSSFNAARWSVAEHGDKRHSLIGFSLYANGPIELLCPAELSTLKTWELWKRTQICIPFQKDEIRTLDAVEQDGESASARSASSDRVDAPVEPTGEAVDAAR